MNFLFLIKTISNLQLTILEVAEALAIKPFLLEAELFHLELAFTFWM